MFMRVSLAQAHHTRPALAYTCSSASLSTHVHVHVHVHGQCNTLALGHLTLVVQKYKVQGTCTCRVPNLNLICICTLTVALDSQSLWTNNRLAWCTGNPVHELTRQYRVVGPFSLYLPLLRSAAVPQYSIYYA